MKAREDGATSVEYVAALLLAGLLVVALASSGLVSRAGRRAVLRREGLDLHAMRTTVTVIALLLVACTNETERVQRDELEQVVVDERFEQVDEGANGTALFRDYTGPASVPPEEVFQIPAGYAPRDYALDDPDHVQSWVRQLSPQDTCIINVERGFAAEQRAPAPDQTILRLLVACQLAE